MSCLEVNTSGQFSICKFFTFSVFHFWHQGFSFLCYQEELETIIHWILGVLKISGRAYEPSRQMHRWPPVDSARVRQTRSMLRFALTMTLSSVSLRVWSMVGVLLSTCSRVPIIISTASIRSGWLSINGRRPMRISLRRISKTCVGWQGLRPTSLSASRRISPSAGWRLVWRWRFRRTEQSLLITLRCSEGGGCVESSFFIFFFFLSTFFCIFAAENK